MDFLAIDFETANYHRHSACAIGLVRVEKGEITSARSSLIRPPEKWFSFSHIHGLVWDDVRHAPSFLELWPEIEPYFSGIDFIVAHNAAFDRSVLNGTCAYYGIKAPVTGFQCTLQMSRKVLGIYPARLPDVCKRLGIKLDNHHDALSDAKACAEIMLYISGRSR